MSARPRVSMSLNRAWSPQKHWNGRDFRHQGRLRGVAHRDRCGSSDSARTCLLCPPSVNDGGVQGSSAKGRAIQGPGKGKIREKEKYGNCVKQEPQLEEV